jgi:hypothetical protein
MVPDSHLQIAAPGKSCFVFSARKSVCIMKLELRVLEEISVIVLPPIRAFAAAIALIRLVYLSSSRVPL